MFSATWSALNVEKIVSRSSKETRRTKRVAANYRGYKSRHCWKLCDLRELEVYGFSSLWKRESYPEKIPSNEHYRRDRTHEFFPKTFKKRIVNSAKNAIIFSSPLIEACWMHKVSNSPSCKLVTKNVTFETGNHLWIKDWGKWIIRCHLFNSNFQLFCSLTRSHIASVTFAIESYLHWVMEMNNLKRWKSFCILSLPDDITAERDIISLQWECLWRQQQIAYLPYQTKILLLDAQ